MSKYPGRIVTDLAPAGYSVLFDGTGDYLTLPTSNSTLWLGSGDYSVESWCYLTTKNALNTLFSYGNTGATFRFFIETSAVSVWFGSNLQLTASNTIPVNTWAHVVATRESGRLRIFVNGVLINNVANSANNNTGTLVIGAEGAGSNPYTGYLANQRIVVGGVPSEYSTSSTTNGTTIFTPPTQVLRTTNTVLLTCNSPAIIDQSNNAFAITVNGNAAVSTFTPFRAYVPYNPALGASTPGVWTLDEAMQARQTRQWNMYDPSFNLTTLLLHGNGTNAAQNNTFLDSSSNNFTITRNGNTTQGSFSPFSQGGWSYLGLANSDRITTSSVDPGNFGSGAFTIEAWVYFNDTGASGQRVIAANYQNSTTGWWFYRNNVGGGAMQFHGSGDGADITGTTIMAPGRWYHVAVSGTPTSPGIKLFVNGVQEGNTYTGAVSLNSTNAVVIGDGAGGAASYGINGYISDFRILKGTALYTTNFTPPTLPLTAITNTSLLTCQSNRFVDNSGNGYTFTVAGTPSIRPFSPFYPTAAYTPSTIGGSGYFDGTGDYLETPNDATLALGSSDFSVEWWEYRTTLAAEDTAIGASGTYGFYFNYYDAGFPRFFLSTSSGSWNVFNNAPTGAISANTWNHFVVTRSGTDFRVFLNGVLSIYATGSGSVVQPNNSFYISGNAAQSHFPGYISSVRVVKGSIPTSYQTSSTTTNTSIFTPPTAPVTTTSQGATANDVELLLNFTNAGIVDSTAKNVLETLGNAQISTTQSKFGGGSISFDGTGDWLLMPHTVDQMFRTGAFTIEMWVYRNASGTYGLVGKGTATTGWLVSLSSSNQVVFTYGSTTITSTGTISSATWTYIAVVREGTGTNQTKIYINGVNDGTGTVSTDFNQTNSMYVGADRTGGSAFNGYIDDLRITRFARYTGAFTPQTSQWQDE